METWADRAFKGIFALVLTLIACGTVWVCGIQAIGRHPPPRQDAFERFVGLDGMSRADLRTMIREEVQKALAEARLLPVEKGALE